MKNKIIGISILVVTVLIIYGGFRIVTNPDTIKATPGSSILGIDNFEIKLPNGWYFLEKGEYGDIYVRTDYKPYNIDLLINYNKNYKSDIEDYKINRKGFDYTKINDGEIFKIACGGALSCNGAIVGNDLYTFGFGVRSDQKPPENLDGIWTPDHNITQEKIQNIMLSIKKTTY